MLQGLNIIHHQQPSDPNDLLSNPPFSHDLAAHLELWSNVTFASDEPFISSRDRDPLEAAIPYDSTSLASDSFSSKDKHVPIIDPALTTSSGSPTDGAAPSPPSTHPNPTFFYDGFLPGFHPDQYSSQFSALYNETSPDSQLHAFGGPTLSALNSRVDELAGHPSPRGPALASKTPSRETRHPSQASTASESTPPPAKKAKTTSKSKATASAARAVSPPVPESVFDGDEDDDDEHAGPTSNKPDLTTPLTASEDKRRRNTAASARFRLKKKEREQAMEKKSKDLETRVSELERECEALRRENGWLKGLVVGVTGGQPGSAPDGPTGIIVPNPLMIPGSAAVTGAKRGRDE